MEAHASWREKRGSDGQMALGGPHLQDALFGNGGLQGGACKGRRPCGQAGALCFAGGDGDGDGGTDYENDKGGGAGRAAGRREDAGAVY